MAGAKLFAERSGPADRAERCFEVQLNRKVFAPIPVKAFRDCDASTLKALGDYACEAISGPALAVFQMNGERKRATACRKAYGADYSPGGEGYVAFNEAGEALAAANVVELEPAHRAWPPALEVDSLASRGRGGASAVLKEVETKAKVIVLKSGGRSCSLAHTLFFARARPTWKVLSLIYKPCTTAWAEAGIPFTRLIGA